MQSFEAELQETLRPLLTLLPLDKASTLESYLDKAKHEDKPQVPYELLSDISSWARANPESLLLPTERYTMISLLAGSVTSPRSHFPHTEPMTLHGRESISETTKEVTALLNCAISIVGAGLAAWFASSKAGWRNEWVRFKLVNRIITDFPKRILFALLASTLVAIVEVALYIVLSSRIEQKAKRKLKKMNKETPAETFTSNKYRENDSKTTLRKRNKHN
jgi:hypothetical protein